MITQFLVRVQVQNENIEQTLVATFLEQQFTIFSYFTFCCDLQLFVISQFSTYFIKSLRGTN